MNRQQQEFICYAIKTNPNIKNSDKSWRNISRTIGVTHITAKNLFNRYVKSKEEIPIEIKLSYSSNIICKDGLLNKYNPYEINKRSTINFEIVKRRDNFVCQKCGQDYLLEVHHILALYLGGDNSVQNLITLCSDCHEHCPDDPNKLYDYLSVPLKHYGNAFLPLLISYHNKVFNQICEIFNIKVDVNYQNGILDNKYFMDNGSPIPKDFIKLIFSEKSCYEFLDKNIIPILNHNLDKCKSYYIWKERGEKLNYATI